MVEDKEQLEKEIIQVIEQNKDICFIDEIFLVYAGVGKTTFYAKKLNKSNDIKSSLEINRLRVKREMKQNWRKKDAPPALQMGMYKLIGTDEERKRLSQTFIELSGDKENPISSVQLDPEQYKELMKEQESIDDC